MIVAMCAVQANLAEEKMEIYQFDGQYSLGRPIMLLQFDLRHSSQTFTIPVMLNASSCGDSLFSVIYIHVRCWYVL